MAAIGAFCFTMTILYLSNEDIFTFCSIIAQNFEENIILTISNDIESVGSLKSSANGNSALP